MPARRPKGRVAPARRKRAGWLVRTVLILAFIAVALVGWGFAARKLAPVSNTSLTRFDALIVLGFPADDEGNPSPEQLARVTEGVREYERGVAPRLILTGGAAHNHFVEAQVMARVAEAQGIPRSAILIEPRAMDTIQNACYSERIMQEHGWHSAEVVSNRSHLPRAALIFGRLPLEWRMHAEVPLAPESASTTDIFTAAEILKTMRYLVWTKWTEHCEP